MKLQSFERVEEKYLLTEKQYIDIMELLKGKIKENKYPSSTISNIYFDTDDFYLVRKSNEKPVYKEKVRLRSYNIPSMSSEVFLELKKKYKGIVGKRRIKLTLDEFYNYYKNNIFEKNNVVISEIDYTMKKYKLKPKMYVGYDRKAYEGVEDSEFRITFDSNLRYRSDNLTLEYGDSGKKYFEDENMYIMEVKTLGAIPLWFCKILSKLKIYKSSFSKYGQIYIKEFEKGIVR